MTISTRKIIKESWVELKAKIGFALPFFLVVFLASSVLGFIGDGDIFSFSTIISIFVLPVLYYMATNVSLSISRKQPVGWKYLLKDFNQKTYLSLLVIAVIINLGMALILGVSAFIAFMIPLFGPLISLILVIFVMIFFIGIAFFPYYCLVDSKTSGLKSIKASFNIGDKNRYFLVKFGLAIFLLNLIGLLALGVGLLITIPLSSIAVANVYDLLKSK